MLMITQLLSILYFFLFFASRYGFDVKGFNKQHKQYNTKTGLERGINRFKKDGYDWQGEID